MRQCIYSLYNRSSKNKETHIGMWHQWGVNYEEYESGPGNYSVGIVENPDGSISLPFADDVQFTDQPPFESVERSQTDNQQHATGLEDSIQTEDGFR